MSKVRGVANVAGLATVATAYHPQSNGIAEGFMKVLGHSLAILTRYRATDWDMH